MASLDLQPNPIVMAIQGGLFFTGLYVVDRCFVRPYRKLKQLRNDKTVGMKQEAEELMKSNQQKSETIEKRLSEASHTAAEILEQQKAKAQQEKQALIAQAEAKLAQDIESLKSQIARTLSEEKSKIPAIVDKLADELLVKLLS